MGGGDYTFWLGASAEEAETGSRERSQSALSPPIGFDPARKDALEIARILAAWRAFKRGAIAWIIRVALAVSLIGMAVHLRLVGLQ